MTRKERLDFCKICKKRQFDPQKGLVCSLTGEWANFNVNCPDFVEDPVAKEKEERSQAYREEIEAESRTGGSANME